MSVESEILRIQRNIADAYTKVSEKGGEVPLQPNSANLAAAVASIPAGSQLTAGDGMTIADGVASVDTPVQGIFTQSEYDDLPEDKKNKGMYVIKDAGGGSGGGGGSSDIYSTEETRIGTWIDGKPLYRKVVEFTFPSSGGWHNGPSYGEVDTITRFEGFVNASDGGALRLPYLNTGSSWSVGINPDKVNGNVIRLDIGNSTASIVVNQPAFVIIEYTKPTDTVEVTA